MPESFEHLLSPLQVGPKLLRNRVLISAHVPRLAVDNLPGAAYIAYHRVRARGGAGLQITGATAVHPTGTLGTPDSLENLDDRIIPGYRQLADAVHGEGGTILAQLARSKGRDAAAITLGDIEAKRDYVYVDDVIGGVALALEGQAGPVGLHARFRVSGQGVGGAVPDLVVDVSAIRT